MSQSRSLIAIALFACSVFAADLRRGTFDGRDVVFDNVNGTAVYQGDIILGRTADIEGAADTKRKESTTVVSRTWSGGVIPYVIDPSFPASRVPDVMAAMAHWSSRTPIRFVARTNEFSYVRFIPGNTAAISCSSNVGMIGGPQPISLPEGCGVGHAIHEIGHAVGLYHEQARFDRNRYMTVLYENMDKPSAVQFTPASSSRDSGPYDFNSIMHYGPFDFARDDISLVLESVPAGIPFGQLDGLSAGDVESVARLYGRPPTVTTISTTPSGLKIRVDGTLVDDGTTFSWTPGSPHTLEAPFQGNDQTRYLFGSWSDGGAVVHNITADPNTTLIVANFIRQHRVIVTISPPDAGTVSIDPPSNDGFYNERASLYINATAAGGFHFVEWSVRPSRSLTPKWTTVLGPTNIVTTFSRNEITRITSTPVGRLITVDGTPGQFGRALISTPVNFGWTAGESHVVAIDDTQPNFEHYRFTGWSDGGPATRTITATGSPATYTATFVPQHSLTVGVLGSLTSDVGVNPKTPDGFYDEGTSVQLVPDASPGFSFTGWTGDVRVTDTPVNLVMDEQKVVYAGFTRTQQVSPIAIVNAATGDQGVISPGELISIYGTNIGPSNGVGLQVSNGRVTTDLGGVQVLFNGQPAPLTYVSDKQVNAVVPYSIANSAAATVQVRYNGQTTQGTTWNVQESVPGIFTANQTGRGPGAILNQDGTVNAADNPAQRGGIIVIYATGEGALNPGVADGQVADSVYPKPVLPVSVRIGGLPAVVHYAGAAPQFVAGLMQINAQIPDGVQLGPKVPIHLVIGTQVSPAGVTVAIR